MGVHLRRSVFDCWADRWTRGLELRRRVLAFGVRTLPSGAEGRCCTSSGRRRRQHFAAPEEKSGWTQGRPARRQDKDHRTRTRYRFEEDALREVAPRNGRRTWRLCSRWETTRPFALKMRWKTAHLRRWCQRKRSIFFARHIDVV